MDSWNEFLNMLQHWYSNFLKDLISRESILQLLLSILAGAAFAALLGTFPSFLHMVLKFLRLEASTESETYSQRLKELTSKLTQSSSEVDSLLAELTQVATEREINVTKIEKRLAELEQQEVQIQKRILDLQQVPIPVAEHFATLIQIGEKRSAWRDYFLFGAGVVVSIIIQAVIR